LKAVSSAYTRKLLGWRPTHATLLEDMETGDYFSAQSASAFDRKRIKRRLNLQHMDKGYLETSDVEVAVWRILYMAVTDSSRKRLKLKSHPDVKGSHKAP